MSAASVRRELARWGVALAVALAQACGGSTQVSAVGDAAPDNGGHGIAADGSTDGPSLEAATNDATGTSSQFV